MLKNQLAGWRRVPAHNGVPDLGAPTCDRAHRGVSMIKMRRKVFDQRKISPFQNLLRCRLIVIRGWYRFVFATPLAAKDGEEASTHEMTPRVAPEEHPAASMPISSIQRSNGTMDLPLDIQSAIHEQTLARLASC